jgi:hypothetical protein
MPVGWVGRRLGIGNVDNHEAVQFSTPLATIFGSQAALREFSRFAWPASPALPLTGPRREADEQVAVIDGISREPPSVSQSDGAAATSISVHGAARTHAADRSRSICCLGRCNRCVLVVVLRCQLIKAIQELRSAAESQDLAFGEIVRHMCEARCRQ